MTSRATVNDYDEEEPDGKAGEPEEETWGYYQLRTPGGKLVWVAVQPGEVSGVKATCVGYEDFTVTAPTIQEALEETRARLVTYEAEGR